MTAEQHFAVTFTAQRTALFTGPLVGRRAHHAARLKLARLRRRIARRGGQPLPVRTFALHFPRAVLGSAGDEWTFRAEAS